MTEEASTEDRQPFLQGRIVISPCKSRLCHDEQFGRTEAIAEEIIQVEIVQLLRSHTILGLLLDVSFRIRRSQFRTDRCVHHIEQVVSLFPEVVRLCTVAYDILYRPSR